MRPARAGHRDLPRDSAPLRVVGRNPGFARPAWWILGWTLGIVMILWATGIVELSNSERRLVDWVGGLSVLVVLVAWVRSNARTLALTREPLERQEALQIRVIRSRRPPLASIGGPDIRPLHRRRRRVPPF